MTTRQKKLILRGVLILAVGVTLSALLSLYATEWLVVVDALVGAALMAVYVAIPLTRISNEEPRHKAR
jgi:hypothetical protein